MDGNACAHNKPATTGMMQVMEMKALRLIGALLVASAVCLPMASAQSKQLQVVGTAAGGENWRNHEAPFWAQTLPKLSDGQLTASAKPLDELGLSGVEVMRLLKFGTYDAVHALTAYAHADSPVLEGIDLAGVAQNYETYRAAVSAYAPVVARELATKFNAHLLALYPSSSLQLWCRFDNAGAKVSLKSLAGKKIRAYSTTLGDFIDGLGANGVTLALAEVVPAIKRDLADCAIAGAKLAYDAKWSQVVTHNLRIRLGYSTSFVAMNLDSWNGLDDPTRKLLASSAARLQDELWQANASADQIAMDCNADGPCGQGKPGQVIAVDPTAQDSKTLSKIVEKFVLARWAERCGSACAQRWNDTVGQVVGMRAAHQ